MARRRIGSAVIAAILATCALTQVEANGPDVVVGELSTEAGESFGLRRFGRVGDITAYSVGTVHCNLGTAPVKWIASTNEHAVIGLNLYRLRDGRFEQIGMSWLMHTYCALQMGACFSDCQPGPDCDTLGVHCSNPHNSAAGWNPANLGPRHQVNAATGLFPYPPTAPAYPATIGRRLQVHDADLHPPLNTGAVYFLEGHDVAADDAQAGNGFNNASYRRVQVIWSGGASTTYNIDFVPGQSTHRESPAIMAWADVDTQVVIGHADVEGDGRLTLASKARDMGGGTWHYEYALYNMNSDRCAGSFTVPIPAGAMVSNVGFHDVTEHSFGTANESFHDGTDWSSTVSADSLGWATTPFSENEMANAVRWGTTYNFRFDADRPPGDVPVEIGLFKPGTPGGVSTSAVGPVAPAATMTGSVSRKTCDLDLLAGVVSESRHGGVSQMRITFDVPPGCPDANGVEICETHCADADVAVPYSGASVVACSVAGNDWILDFSPGLENGRGYRILIGPAVSSVAGQFVDVRCLLGDVNSDGHVNSLDRSVVVGAWTSSGFTCPTDLDLDGSTNAIDRSVVVAVWTGSENCAPDPMACSALRSR